MHDGTEVHTWHIGRVVEYMRVVGPKTFYIQFCFIRPYQIDLGFIQQFEIIR